MIVIALIALAVVVVTVAMGLSATRRLRTGAEPEPEQQSGATGPELAPVASMLDRELQTLTQQGVLSAEQVAKLRQAAQQDRDAASVGNVREPASTGVLDVLGYVGGALLLGALIFVGFTLWDDLTRAAKTLLAVASFAVPAVGGTVLVLSRARRGLALALLALASFAAGFACFMIIDDDDLMTSAAVVVLTAAIGAAVLRSSVFYLPAWVGAMGFVPAWGINGMNLSERDLATAIAVGWLVVGMLFVGAGLVLGRDLAWSLAGISGWASTAPLLSFEHSYLALALASVVAAGLFIGVVRLQTYAFAVVGCLIVLSIWPIALYQILDTALGVALGLVAAGCVLIAAAVVISRLRHRAATVGGGGGNPVRA
jgi:hypothetical protein